LAAACAAYVFSALVDFVALGVHQVLDDGVKIAALTLSYLGLTPLNAWTDWCRTICARGAQSHSVSIERACRIVEGKPRAPMAANRMAGAALHLVEQAPPASDLRRFRRRFVWRLRCESVEGSRSFTPVVLILGENAREARK
jgi:hypothetical protein